MSIINQMLKDLEKRSQPQPPIVFSGNFFSKKPASFKPKNFLLITLLIIVFLSIAIIGKAFFKLNQNRLITLSISAPINPHKKFINNNPIENILHKIPTALTAIALTTGKDITDLSFMLTQDALYRIEQHPNKIVFHFEDTHAITDLPNINYVNSAIKKMTMHNLPNGELLITIFLIPGAELEQLKTNEIKRNTELHLVFSQIEEGIATIQANADKPQPAARHFSPIKKMIVNLDETDNYQKAIEALAAGNDTLAFSLLNELVQKHPSYYLGREALIKLLIQHGNTKDAVNLLQVGLVQNPTYLPFLELQARLYADDGKPQQALDIMHRFQPDINKNPDYYALIAALYQRVGESMMSAKLYEQLLRINNTKAEWWVGFGIALESLNKPNEATQAYVKARDSEGLTPELSAYVDGRIQTG